MTDTQWKVGAATSVEALRPNVYDRPVRVRDKGGWHIGLSATDARTLAEALLKAADATETLAAAESTGCTISPSCAAVHHVESCLGLYRTPHEVESGVIPNVPELERRRVNEQWARTIQRGSTTERGGA